jgi:hypothetical protein
MQGKGLIFVTGDRLGDQLTALLEEAARWYVGRSRARRHLRFFPKRSGHGGLARRM